MLKFVEIRMMTDEYNKIREANTPCIFMLAIIHL